MQAGPAANAAAALIQMGTRLRQQACRARCYHCCFRLLFTAALVGEPCRSWTLRSSGWVASWRPRSSWLSGCKVRASAALCYWYSGAAGCKEG